VIVARVIFGNHSAVVLSRTDQLKADNLDEMRRRIVDFGVKVIEMPDPHLYFQAPGGQPFRLVGINEYLSHYAGITDHRELPSHFA
jgi:hypothetical protein